MLSVVILAAALQTTSL